VKQLVMKTFASLLMICLFIHLSNASEPCGIPRGFIESLGYKIQNHGFAEPSHWEREQFNLLGKNSMQIKSMKALEGEPHTYYRFTISEERYGSEAEARARLRRLFDRPPGLSPESGKAFPLRKGFSHNNAVYVVSTDVSMFSPELERLAGKLQRQIRRAK
jgi:hypothetical protein